MFVMYARRLYGLMIVALLLATSSLTLAQSSGCPGMISGSDCQIFEGALNQFASARAVEISMMFSSEIEMGNMMSQNTSGEARGTLVLDDEGRAIEASLIINPLTAKTGGFAGLYSTSGNNDMVGGFILKDGVMYFGLGSTEDDLGWYSTPASEFGLSITRSIPTNFFAMMPNVMSAWHRADNLVFENDDRSWTAFETYISTDSAMTEALALIGGASGQNSSDAAVGAMFGGLMGMGFDSEFPSLVEYYGNIYVEPTTGELGGFGTVTSVQVDAGNVMGGDILSSMVGSTGSILNSLVVHMLDYKVVPNISAPEKSEPMSSSMASVAHVFSATGLYTTISGTFAQILANPMLMVNSTNTVSGDRVNNTPSVVATEQGWVPSSTETIIVPVSDFDTYPGGYRVEIFQYEIDPVRDTVRVHFEATASNTDLRPPSGTYLLTSMGRVAPINEEWTNSGQTRYFGWLEFEGRYFRESDSNSVEYCGCGLYSIPSTDLRSYYR